MIASSLPTLHPTNIRRFQDHCCMHIWMVYFPTVDTCYNVAKSFHWYSCCQDLQNTMRVIASKDSNDDFITLLSSVPSSPGLVKTTCRQCRQSQEVVVHKIKIHTAKDTVIGDNNKQKLRTLTKDCESAHSSHQLDHCSHWQKLTYLQTWHLH